MMLLKNWGTKCWSCVLLYPSISDCSPKRLWTRSLCERIWNHHQWQTCLSWSSSSSSSMGKCGLWCFLRHFLLIYCKSTYWCVLINKKCYMQLKYNETGKEKECLPQVGQWNMMNKVQYCCLNVQHVCKRPYWKQVFVLLLT